MIPIRIASLSVDTASNQPVILLSPAEDSADNDRFLPIWIGHAEATAILLALQNAEPPRPMTHDLFKNVLDALDAAVTRVEITRVNKGIFYATLILHNKGASITIDARPSDSIALAIRAGAPIFVTEEVFDKAAVIAVDRAADEDAEVEQFRQFLDHVDPSDFQS